MQQKVVMRVPNDRQTVPLLHPMEERTGERRWPPLSPVLSPLLRRGARKKNPRSGKFARPATISTDTGRLQVCATGAASTLNTYNASSFPCIHSTRSSPELELTPAVGRQVRVNVDHLKDCGNQLEKGLICRGHSPHDEKQTPDKYAGLGRQPVAGFLRHPGRKRAKTVQRRHG